ncbi:MAG: type II toxin-antitoxin system RatA family toxin [Acidiferrobacterales bacterium]
MNAIKRSALVPYSAQEMYDLVADVKSYPQFLPWCGGARIISQNDDEMIASIDIDFHRIRKSFTTRNRLQQGKLMEVRLIEGPFKQLQGLWQFYALDSRHSKISLDLEFDFASRVLSLTLGPVFANIANSLVGSFTKRALELYGERS